MKEPRSSTEIIMISALHIIAEGLEFTEQTALMEAAGRLEELSQECEKLRQERDELAADSGRLDWLEKQARKSRTGISFDWVPSCDGDTSGFRFMRFRHVGLPEKTLRAVIDKQIRHQDEEAK